MTRKSNYLLFHSDLISLIVLANIKFKNKVKLDNEKNVPRSNLGNLHSVLSDVSVKYKIDFVVTPNKTTLAKDNDTNHWFTILKFITQSI
ncbi:hypothetical protein BLOT_010986 [Blomia tropicalis]|nr:hypothetical protein BLOT_010986 [Blomia tropicalis]